MIEAFLKSLGLIGNAIILLVGMLALDKSSDITVDNAVKVAEITGLGKTTVGFLLIALTTTLPELSVSALSAANPESIGIAIGNALGSNIVNVCLILGLGFLVLSLRSRGKTRHLSSMGDEEVKNVYFGLLIASLVPLALIYIGFVSRIIGAVLIVIFIMNGFRMIRSRRSKAAAPSLSEKSGTFKHILLTLLGALAVVSCAFFIVRSASYIAETVGIPNILIGATIVAFGTSLPELMNSINAAKKGHIELALGNIIGSCFINITLVLGVALVGGPFQVNIAAYSDLVTFSIMANLLLWYFLSNNRVSWREGTILIFMYMLFVISSFGAMRI